jgi:hypothetical protein
MHLPSDIPRRADLIGADLDDRDVEIPNATSGRRGEALRLARSGYTPRKRSRLSLVVTWLPRAFPYGARLLGPGLAAAALVGLGAEVVLGSDRGVFGEATVPAAIVAAVVGVAACIVGAAASIRQYRTQIPPSPHL